VKILLATDGSENSAGAARFVTRLNLASDDEVTIFHAIYGLPCLYGRKVYYDALEAMKKETAPVTLDSAMDILGTVKAKISTLIMDGFPVSCIIDASVESGIDLIVLGAKGINSGESYFIGSVTRAVAIQSPKPVLVIKVTKSEQTGGTKILFATDGSEHSAATAGILSEIPFPLGTAITILNVIPWEFLDIPKEYVPDINERFNEIIEETGSKRLIESKRIFEQTREYLKNNFTDMRELLKFGEPQTEIMRASEDLSADLLAVGCRGLRGIKGMMGSVSRNILEESKCSVLIGNTSKK